MLHQAISGVEVPPGDCCPGEHRQDCQGLLETLLDQRGAAKGPFWFYSLAVVSFCSSSSKTGSVNLDNHMVS